MDGDSISLAGQVASSMDRHTREGKPYVIARLKLPLGGEIDLFVWEEARERTWGLWNEGSLLRVSGKVRVRGDRISVTCTSALPLVSNEESDDGETRDDADAVDGGERPREDPLVAVGTPAERDDPAGSLDGGAVPTEQPPRRLRLLLRESDEPGHDLRLLEDIKDLLMENQGDDEITLQIASEGRIISLDWPIVKVEAQPDLERTLMELVGSAGRVTVEGLDGAGEADASA